METPIDWTVPTPACSFRYDGKESSDFLGRWTRTETVEKSAGGSAQRIDFRDPAAVLRVTARVRRFADSPATDWVLEFTNEGRCDTPMLENILPLDVAWPVKETEPIRLHRAKGSSCRMDDFLPITDLLPPGRKVALAPVGGRSSNGALPFVNLQWAGGGTIVAVGWSGQWAANFERSADSIRLTCGQERTHLRLRPGETIRTPRILQIPWQGDDPDIGTNALRRLLMAHYLPRLDGELALPPAACCMQGWYYRTGQVSQENELACLARAAEIGADAYWIDACWYGAGRDWWQEVGNWNIRREVFPDGLKPIADVAHAKGMKFVLWFEPERVRPGTIIEREHPEFLLRRQEDKDNLLLDLGLPEARGYITEAVARIVAETGVDIYRQDFNFDPLPYWQQADAPDRIGMHEIRHVEGLYAMWDDLRRRFPRLAIDNCASGGRRIDLETLSRSLPLWRSDFGDVVGPPHGQGLHVGSQCNSAGLSRWVPLHGGGVWCFQPYATRSAMVAGFTFGGHIPDEALPGENDPAPSHKEMLQRCIFMQSPRFPMADARAAIAEFNSLRAFFTGDFHLLSPLTIEYHDWCAFQFHRQDLSAGCALFFRRHRSGFPSLAAQLRGIDPKGKYEVSLTATYDPAPPRRMAGEELAKITIPIPAIPGSMLLRYRSVS